jgi:uncharacterized protein YndB with AHSA1/START domain
MEKFDTSASIIIDVDPAIVWDAITNPEIIKQYFFGVEVESDWKVGSPITYKGQWEGKEFVDKGNIIKSEPEKLLLVNYWTSFSGLEDSLENYQNVAYKLEKADHGTKLTIEQDGIPSQESADSSKKNWEATLAEMKKVLEA